MTTTPTAPDTPDTPGLLGPAAPAPHELAAAYDGRYAGFVSRAASFIIDVIVCACLSTGMIFFVQALIALLDAEPIGDVVVNGEVLSWLIFGVIVLYFTLGWAVVQRTAGEALMGLRVIRPNGKRVHLVRAFVRFLMTFVSISALGLGFLWILFDRRRRTWQDLVARTVVVYDFGVDR